VLLEAIKKSLTPYYYGDGREAEFDNDVEHTYDLLHNRYTMLDATINKAGVILTTDHCD
jgi:hypothetical protein